MPKITVTSLFVDDQDRALTFYTDVLGFAPKDDVPAGEYRWLTVVSADNPDGTQLVLEPSAHPAAQAYAAAIRSDGIPATMFVVEDLSAYREEIAEKGATIVQEPTEMGPVSTMIVDDSCGNLVQFVQHHSN